MEPADVPFTWDTLAPLALPDLPEEIGHRLYKRSCSPRTNSGKASRYRQSLSTIPPTLHATISGACVGAGAGPSWVNAAWFVWIGLNRLGYHDAVAEMRDRLVTVVLREYYEARTGKGMGASDFGWSSPVWEIADPLD